ncbi:PSD1 and planctomycete cytochrome C domain-containing protein [Lignipirellula cremea]|uniref:Planctomycete cytochrome C n=1 Tax=Lignipirellula cremea TaxID=2528010 RepID=A0A518DZY5_9BACT|nr:PSD1 and planctomycete cytochrome C domain-containing protein [Lignipirellula cremea]QDU97399.1 Planctomycete cytochrome C [Lignipirellula cremea]
MPNHLLCWLKPVALLAAAAWVSLQGAPATCADDAAGLELFEKQIRPVLVAQCYQCHSAEAEQAGKLKAGLRLDTREGLLQGGESGAAIVPGNTRKGLLLSALRYEDLEMPPKQKLPDDVIGAFEKWIELGAPDPREETQVAGAQRVIDLDEGRQFWCFQPVQQPTPPQVASDWPRSDIDQFILARLNAEKLQPVADASPGVLVRRLYLDLIGLPPSPAQQASFEQAHAKDAQKAVAVLVDELLDSPQFGERWGRHWLDVARYAESNGNSRNATFPHAWRYRDYVIDAFNADTPYDRFLLEQIAGDLLPATSPVERNRNLVATGFLALGSKPVIGKGSGFSPDIVADQIEVVTRGVLGLTVSCARCHDHKFDPIPTTDYYGLAGVFASTETLYGGGSGGMNGAPATDLHALASSDPAVSQAYEDWQASLDAVLERQKKVDAQLQKMGVGPKRKGAGKKAAANRARRKNKNADEPAAANDGKVAQLQEQSRQIAAELKQLRDKAVDPPGEAMGARELGRVLETPIYIRGETPKGPVIPRRFVSVALQETPVLPTDASGRLELAQWLGDRGNPLTARVLANRIWLHLLGEGLVRTPDNFGVNGELPSHPELLDALASQLMADDWSIKSLIRRIVLSRTYQLSGAYDGHNYETDPDNVFLWRHTRRRLEAEAIRDGMLAVSGQLDISRPAGSVVSRYNGQLIQDKLTPDVIHQPSLHRAIYLPILRNGLPEELEVFDVAEPSLVVGQRSVTTVPAQDLFLMNSPLVAEQAGHFARLIQAAGSDDASRIEAAYRRALNRSPEPRETERAITFLKQARTALQPQGDANAANDQAWSALCQGLFLSAEFRYLP